MRAPRRRVLPLADCRILYRTASEGTIEIKGMGRFDYRPLVAEPWEELLRYMPEHVLRTREFLLSGTGCNWIDQDGKQFSLYRLQWPGEDVELEAVGGKQCADLLRRYWPARDHAKDQHHAEGEEDMPEGEGRQADRVVPFRESATEIRHRLRQSDPAWTPGRIG